MSTIIGTSKKNKLVGTSASDLIKGFAGDDTLLGMAGNDTILGGAGRDKIDGGAGNDKLNGEAGNDNITGGLGKDVINGGADNDRLDGGKDSDVIHGGVGNDVIIGGLGNDAMAGDEGNDILMAGPGADVIDGGANDQLSLSPELNMGDVLSYADATAGVGVDLSNPVTATGGAAGDTWSNVESLIGSRYNDILVGGASDLTYVFGGAGDDAIFANANPAITLMRGDSGFDFLVGQAGNLDVNWLQYGMGTDKVINFDQGNDKLLVSKADFGLASNAPGLLLATELEVSLDHNALSSATRFVYEADNHILWADKDGNGLLFFPEPIAILDGVATLAISDFFIIP